MTATAFSALPWLLPAVLNVPLFTEGILPPPGLWLVFGVIGLPVYAILLGWYFGKPTNPRMVTMGVGYLISLTVMLWTGFYILTVVINLLFF